MVEDGWIREYGMDVREVCEELFAMEMMIYRVV